MQSVLLQKWRPICKNQLQSPEFLPRGPRLIWNDSAEIEAKYSNAT